MCCVRVQPCHRHPCQTFLVHLVPGTLGSSRRLWTLKDQSPSDLPSCCFWVGGSLRISMLRSYSGPNPAVMLGKGVVEDRYLLRIWCLVTHPLGVSPLTPPPPKKKKHVETSSALGAFYGTDEKREDGSVRSVRLNARAGSPAGYGKTQIGGCTMHTCALPPENELPIGFLEQGLARR